MSALYMRTSFGSDGFEPHWAARLLLSYLTALACMPKQRNTQEATLSYEGKPEARTRATLVRTSLYATY